MSTHEDTWRQYTLSWATDSDSERAELFAKTLDPECRYTDPLAATEGWKQLADYMRQFHQQLPGGHFETTSFSSHHNKSIALWKMRDGQGEVVSDGVSYGEYNAQGRLITMTGFFETPPA